MDRDASWRDDRVRHRDTEHHTHRDCGHLERERQRETKRDTAREEMQRDGDKPRDRKRWRKTPEQSPTHQTRR